MIVVSDTSPINYLLLIGESEVLPRLFGEVYAPPEVIAELCHLRTPEVVRRWAQQPPAWMRVVKAREALECPARLGPGEASAMALAKELNADWLLMDERDGTKFAAAQGLRVLGTLTVLEQAARMDLLQLPEALRKLQNTSFRVSLQLIRAALERDVARRKPAT